MNNRSETERKLPKMKSDYTSYVHKNPSRKSCEQTIKKILTREFEEFGENRHFKQASDFMVYFESLHPASSSLTKQVQRAVNSLNLPRDENGYFMINKTAEEYAAERELNHLLKDANLENLANTTPVLLKLESWKCKYVMHLLESNSKINAVNHTMLETSNGILFFTSDSDKLLSYLSSFMNFQETNS